MDASIEGLVEVLAAEVAGRLAGARSTGQAEAAIPIGVSARHAHLCRADVDALFGSGHRLTVSKDLSQPGQFACEERVTAVGPTGTAVEGLRILGPERSRSQVELAASDARALRIDAPVRESGDLDGSAPIALVGPAGAVFLREGAIIAKRHIHFSPVDARRFGVADRDIVSVAVAGPKGGVLAGVVCRVSPDYALDMHLDTDEANALGIGSASVATIRSKE